MTAKRLRFGCQYQPFKGKQQMLESARRMEAIGIDVATFPDHFGGWASVWTSMTAVAAATTTLRLGSLTINNDIWNPVVLARDVASADQLSDGRLELGLGAGWRDVDYAMTGIHKDSPGTRIARLAEAVDVIRGYLAPGELVHHGTFYDVELPADRLRAVQEGGVPIFIGGGGRKIVRLAATTADIVGVHINLGAGGFTIGRGADDEEQGVVEEAVDERLGWIREDRSPAMPEPELQLFLMEVRPAATPEAAAEEVAPTFGISPESAVRSPYFLLGPPEAMADKALAIKERYGITYLTCREDHIDTMEQVLPIIDREG